MGIFKMSVGSYDLPASTPIPDNNPNPRNFVVEATIVIGAHTIALIEYPDCTNFEGRKILLFKNTMPNMVERADFIDPHFTDKDTLKPFARFEPTREGMEAARLLATVLPI